MPNPSCAPLPPPFSHCGLDTDASRSLPVNARWKYGSAQVSSVAYSRKPPYGPGEDDTAVDGAGAELAAGAVGHHNPAVPLELEPKTTAAA